MAKKIIFFISLWTFMYAGTLNGKERHEIRDSLNISLYKPTKQGEVVLDKVLNTKHQWLEETGTYNISQYMYSDSVISLNIYYNSTFGKSTLNNYYAQKYIGCVLYRDNLFFLDKTFEQGGNLFFEYTDLTRSFRDYGPLQINIINDKIISWAFIFGNGCLQSVNLFPPTTIFDFDCSQFE